MNIELFNKTSKRNPTILFIIFTIITLGIYQLFWVFSRTDSLNNITKSKINGALPFFYLLGFILIFGIGFYEGWVGYGYSESSYSSILPLIQLLDLVLMWIIAFKMKNILKEFSYNNDIYIRYNGFLTFLLTFTYINYKINENIDYISDPRSLHSIVDKGEKPTSDTEATSDKLPRGPEEKMQKLSDMKEKGLINEEDYNSKKEEILKGM